MVWHSGWLLAMLCRSIWMHEIQQKYKYIGLFIKVIVHHPLQWPSEAHFIPPGTTTSIVIKPTYSYITSRVERLSPSERACLYPVSLLSRKIYVKIYFIACAYLNVLGCWVLMPKTDVCMAVWCVNDDRWMTENCGGVWIELGHLLSFWHSSHTSVTNARHPSEACVTCTNKHRAVIQSSIHRHCPRKKKL